MNEEDLIKSLITVLRDINGSLERVAEAMEESNKPNLKIDENGDRL